MRKLIVLALVVFVLTACARTVRFSLAEIEEYPPQIQEQIKRGEVSMGMTFQQVRYAWGAPNKVIVKGGDDQGRFIVEWIYARARVLGKRVVFADGKLIKAYTRVTRSDVRDDMRKSGPSGDSAPQDTSGGGQPQGEEEIQE